MKRKQTALPRLLLTLSSQLHDGLWLTSSSTPLGIGSDFTSQTIKPTPSHSLEASSSPAPRQAAERWGERSLMGGGVFVLDPYPRYILVGEEPAERFEPRLNLLAGSRRLEPLW